MKRDRRLRQKVEKWLGRRLKPNEIIHHKDHNSQNNNFDNLEILTKEEHRILHFKGKNALYKYRRKKNV